MTSAVSHWRSRRPPHQGWKPCSSVTPGSTSSRPEAHPRVLLFLLFCFHCCRCGVSPPTSLCPPGSLPQPRLPVQFLQRALAVLSSRNSLFRSVSRLLRSCQGRPCAKESKAEPLSSVFRLCSSWGIWENRYRGVPGSLPNAPLLAKVPGRRPNPSGGWGEGWPMETTAGFQLWAPSVLPELTSQTCRSSLGVLQRRGLILSTWGAP